MGLPTLTRAIGAREDYLDTQNFIFSNSGNFGGSTNSTDGDIITFTSVLTNSTAADNFLPYRSVSLSSTTYPYIIARVKVATLDAGAGLQVQLYAHFTDLTTSSTVIATAHTTALTVYTSPALPTGKTIDRIGVVVQSTVSQSGIFNINYQVDFVMSFKETLTLPSVIQPIQQQKIRNVVVLPILGREGGIAQDLGSLSTEYTISGGLVTTGPYTADQWWHVFDGLVLESGVFQADGNETWQWLTTDQIGAKVLVKAWGPQQVPGRVAYHDYSLLLTKFDVIGETYASIGAIT